MARHREAPCERRARGKSRETRAERPANYRSIFFMSSGQTTSRVGWFCLRAHTRREFAAAEHLRLRTGVEVFSPRIRCGKNPEANSAASTSRQGEPLFPGYLFARFEYPQQLRHVLSTQGVTGVVSFGGHPPAVADGVIDFLRAQVDLANRVDPAPEFAAGAWVKIVAGCFRDAEGEVVSSDSRTARVRVLLHLLGRSVQVSVPAQQLVAGAEVSRIPAELRAVPQGTAPVRR